MTAKKHSLIGVFSCVVAIAMFSAFVLTSLVYYLQFSHMIDGGLGSLGLLQMMVEMVLPVPTHVVGLILGIVAVFFPLRKKFFPVLGIILNLVFGLCSLFPWLYLAFASLGRVQ